MQLITLLSFAAGFAATVSAGETPASAPIYLQPVVQGCFKSAGDLVLNQSYTWNSRKQCGLTACQQYMKKNVAATSAGNLCYCGDSYPPKDTLVDDSFCNTPCTGYPSEICGGTGYYTVYNTGLLLSGVPYADDKSSSSSASTSSSTAAASSSTVAQTTTSPTSASTTVVGGHTVFVTQTSSATTSAEPEKKSGGKSNTVGIAVGVVVGVVAVAAIAGGAFLLLRRRRNKEIEEEYRRNAAVNAFFGSGKSDGGGLPGSDARLDPVMAQRRLSDGSIADNEDYSRRILRVTNA